MGETRVCGNCGGAMSFLKRERIQLGQTGWVLGDLPNLFAGAQDLEFWVCPRCRKLDFYLPDGEEETEVQDGGSMAQVVCPVCGAEHDMDDAKCPRCGAVNSILYQ